MVERTGERTWEAEIHRPTGQLLLSWSAEHRAEAEAQLRRALDLAGRQSARTLELRAATNLAGMWRDQGKFAEARGLLAPLYGWFTEGFDTADLQAARTLLDELPQPADHRPTLSS